MTAPNVNVRKVTQHPLNMQAPNVQPQAPQQPQAGGAQVSQINPNADLRSQQIAPGTSPRLGQTQNLVNQSATQVAQGGYSPFSTYQQTAVPYQQAGVNQFDQAVNAGQQQAQYLGQAGNTLSGLGYGQYNQINPTLGAGNYASPGQVSAPTFSQGALTLPGVTTGQVNGLQNLAFGNDTQNLRGLTSTGVQSLYDAPNRSDLAAKAFQLLQEQAAPQQAADVRALGQATGKFGRMGSGLVNTQLADIGTAYKQSADQAARGLALDAAGQEMNDRLSRLSATQSGLGQLAGLDQALNTSGNENILAKYDRDISRDSLANQLALSQGQFNLSRDQAMNDALYRSQSTNAANQLQAAGLNADIANMAFGQQANNRDFSFGVDQARNNLGLNVADAYRGLGNDTLARGQFQSGLADQAFGRGDAERNFLSQYETNRNNYGLDRLGTLAGLEGQQFGQDLTSRNELRGERDYQNQLEQQAFDRSYQQLMTEEGLLGNQFDRNQREIGTLGGLGYGTDPTSTLMGRANQLSGQASDAFAGVGSLLGQYAFGQGAPQGGQTPVPAEQAAFGRIDPNAVLAGYRPNVQRTTRYG